MNHINESELSEAELLEKAVELLRNSKGYILITRINNGSAAGLATDGFTPDEVLFGLTHAAQTLFPEDLH